MEGFSLNVNGIGPKESVSFTDEQIKQMRKWSEEKNMGLLEEHKDINALLARLEAAEECAKALEVVEELREPCYYPCLTKWRKACGK